MPTPSAFGPPFGLRPAGGIRNLRPMQPVTTSPHTRGQVRLDGVRSDDGAIRSTADLRARAAMRPMRTLGIRSRRRRRPPVPVQRLPMQSPSGGCRGAGQPRRSAWRCASPSEASTEPGVRASDPSRRPWLGSGSSPSNRLGVVLTHSNSALRLRGHSYDRLELWIEVRQRSEIANAVVDHNPHALVLPRVRTSLTRSARPRNSISSVADYTETPSVTGARPTALPTGRPRPDSRSHRITHRDPGAITPSSLAPSSVVRRG
jgi:hypothetical protein